MALQAIPEVNLMLVKSQSSGLYLPYAIKVEDEPLTLGDQFVPNIFKGSQIDDFKERFVRYLGSGINIDGKIHRFGLAPRSDAYAEVWNYSYDENRFDCVGAYEITDIGAKVLPGGRYVNLVETILKPRYVDEIVRSTDQLLADVRQRQD
jgi:hypothetical protein